MALDTTTTISLAPDFADRLSTKLLLAPDVDLVFARWAFSALVQQSAGGEDGFDLAVLQLRDNRIATGGPSDGFAAAMSSGMGGDLVSMGMLYPDMFQMVQEAKSPGEVIKINRPRYVSGDNTEANRLLATTGTLFGNSQALSMDQVAVTIREYVGPLDSTGVKAPLSLSLFAQNRSEHDLLQYFQTALRRDRWGFVEALVQTRLIAAANANDTGEASGSSVTRGGKVASNAAFTGTDNEPMSYDLVVRVGEQLKTRKIPGVGGAAKYAFVMDPHQVAQLKLDPQYQRLSVLEPQWNPLFPGYLKTVDNLIVCESNNMPRLTNLGAGANITGYQGLVIAPGVLGWASAMNALALRDKNDDGGRFARFGWTAFEGFQVLDDRFVQLVITD